MLQIKEFTEINAVSGNEKAMRDKIIECITPYATDITVDTIGNVIAFKKGTIDGGKKFVLSAHMDEVGFIVSDVTEDGYIKFKSVGGIDPRIMLAQRVVIGDDRIPGIMGIKAVHLQSPEERKNVVKEKDMYIDIGATSKEGALAKVQKGDYISFDSDYRELGDDIIKAKALDDRVGCAIMTELIKYSYPNDIYFCFTVQEEVGVRGATVAARRIKADMALMLEATTCADTAGSEPHEYATQLGKGPVLSIMDRGAYSDRELNKFIEDIAKREGIEYQYKKTGMGANESRAYQISSLPCKTAAISLPARYIHSPVSCGKKSDIDKMYLLAKAICENIHSF